MNVILSEAMKTPVSVPRFLYYLIIPALVCCFAGTAIHAGETVEDIRRHGAKGDGKTLCTAAIQEAIDRCAAQGGGTVYLPPGVWLSGTLLMKDHVTLWLEGGCTLLGSKNPEDYPKKVSSVRSWTDQYVSQSLIYGEGLKNISIRGRGAINGNGGAFLRKEYATRPYAIRLVNCRDVLVEGVRLEDSAMWMQHYLACERVTLRGVAVYNFATYNNDGVDIDGCRDVCISDCRFETDDDAITLKSTLDRPCENVVITNCTAASHCNAIKAGTESHGGFKNITISNCTICPPSQKKVKYGRERGVSGISLEVVDGGHLDRVAINNITIQGVCVPIFMRLGNRGRIFKEGIPKPGAGTFRNVAVSNVVATGVSPIGCAIAGIPGHPIENVSLANIQLSFEGGGSLADAARNIAEKEEDYPECMMFGALPAYGFYCRHVKDLSLTNVRLRTARPDLRHSLVCDDAENISIAGLDAQYSPAAAALIRLAGVQGALISGCAPQAPKGAFLALEGSRTQRIALMGNDFGDAGTVVRWGSTVPKDAVRFGGKPLHID